MREASSVGALVSAVAQLSACFKHRGGVIVMVAELFTESPREGHPFAVRAEVQFADSVEQILADGNRCNWLIGYGDGVNEYCGKPGGPACNVHEFYAKGWI